VVRHLPTDGEEPKSVAIDQGALRAGSPAIVVSYRGDRLVATSIAILGPSTVVQQGNSARLHTHAGIALD
jgi:hypothetical protein